MSKSNVTVDLEYLQSLECDSRNLAKLIKEVEMLAEMFGDRDGTYGALLESLNQHD